MTPSRISDKENGKLQTVILIVESEPAMRVGLRDNLEFNGYDVHVAADATQAREILRRHTPTIVLLSNALPVSQAALISRLLKKNNQRPSVIVMESQEPNYSFFPGADDYLNIPCSITELASRVNKYLGLQKHTLCIG
ncbi:response regulator transcription factor [Methylogaea oryzae]|uniref:response regulator transcription factor n=1 Tax=Methylogaea oryzae TaxID=1295382 RepID=UPI001C80C343|nr:response regulator [Methylogaea oryzae]